MSFKQFFNEMKEREKFTIKKNNKRWTFTQESSGKRYFVKIDPVDVFDSLGSFLREIDAKATLTNEKGGYVDHFGFVNDIVKGSKSSVYVTPGMVEKIKKTWVLQ